ncbi:translation elongation factor Ts [Candidatus Sumerlaeota bacterium]|nr:translation elongation factor Ts [Candidatus Sumerlaeota bacterium]
MSISAKLVKELRQRTGAGIMDCKNALEEAGGDLEKAVELLRKRGKEIAAKKSTRKASEGIVYSYIHPPGKVGTIIELNCETDFVAKNERFLNLAKDLAMHITAMAPQFMNIEEVPPELLQKQKEIYLEQARAEKEDEARVNQIVEDKINRFFAENCLMSQPFIKDPDKTIKDLIEENVAVLGENIVLRRYVRFSVGETDEKEET